MEENRMPTLFEILNRFSKPPVDLWSFYVFMKEQYGGVEYLEFWLDCATHTNLCKELAQEILRSSKNPRDGSHSVLPRAMTSKANSRYTHQNQLLSLDALSSPELLAEGFPTTNYNNSSSQSQSHNHNLTTSGPHHSPNSSVLFDILRDDVLDTSSDQQQSRDQAQRESLSRDVSNEEEHDEFDASGPLRRAKRYSTMSLERARNKRDTVSRLSEILDNMQMPEYPDATATSPTRDPRSGDESIQRHRRLPSDLDEPYGNDGQWDAGLRIDTGAASRPYTDVSSSPDRRRSRDYRNSRNSDIIGNLNAGDSTFRQPPQTPPPRVAATTSANAVTENLTSNARTPKHMHDRSTSNQSNNRNSNNSGSVNSNSNLNAVRKAVHDSALRIIYTYLTPKSPKAIELPSDATGWSMAEDIRQTSTLPGGLDNPKLFEPAAIYVFDALEREALPAFLMYRALSNVQPVSATLRLTVGLLGLFGGFWLSFVFVLLDWQPKAHRCWIILPFALGWYLVITALYHIDPMLAFTSIGERDGGGFAKVQETFVKKILLKRSVFVIVATVLLTAAFSVLFIFVPGHRL